MDYSLRDLIDIPQLAKLLDSLDAVQAMPSAIIDMEGNVLTATGWQDICTKFHRAHPDTERQCRESDTYFANKLCDKGGHYIYKCPMGLVDTATPIIVEGKHIGNVFTGQLFLEPPNEETFLDQARRYGFDPIAYLEAVRKVPVFTEEQLRKNLTFLHQLAEMLANEGLKKKRLVEAEEALRESKNQLRTLIDTLPDLVWLKDSQGIYLACNHRFERFFGAKEQEIIGKTDYDFLDEDLAKFFREKDRIAMTAGKPTSNEERVTFNCDGHQEDLETIKTPILDSDGRLYGILGIGRDITERKQAETALLESEKSLRKAQQVAHVGSWTWNIKADRLEWSDEMYHIFGIEKDKFHGALSEVIAQAIHPDDRTAVDQSNLSVTQQGIPVPLEYRVIWPDGTMRVVWAEAGEITLDEAGKPVLLTGIVQDITGRKKAETALRESEARFVSMAENSPVAIYRFSNRKGGLYYSPRIRDLLGYTPEYLLEHPLLWHDSIHPEDLSEVEAAIAEMLTGQTDLDLTYRIRDASGQERRFRDRAIPHRQPDGELIIDGVAMDITEISRAETALRESEEKFAKIYRLSPDAIDLTRLETGVEVELNQSYLKMFGYAREELIGHSTLPEDLGIWVSKENRDRLIACLKDHGEELEFETLLRRKDGSIFVCLISSTLLDIGGERYNLSICRDITERIKAEKEIRSLNQNLEGRVQERTAQLEATNKEMEAFSYSVSHDLRAPLRSIEGFSRVLMEDYQAQVDEAGRHYFSRIHLGAQRMGNLIDNLLKLSKTSRSELAVSECDLSRLSSRITGDLADLHPERKVEVFIQPGMFVQADHNLMQVMLENLLGNAWKYTSRSQAPSIKVGETVSSSGERLFFIRDNGAGFDMAHADKLFNAFQRLHSTNEFEGTGIGLSIVQRIILRHGGRIWAEAKPGKGATFFFTLPS